MKNLFESKSNIILWTRRILLLLLLFCLTNEMKVAALRNPKIVSDTSMTAGQKVTWDCVWFGSYPQREVVARASQSGCYGNPWSTADDYIVDSDLYNTLSNATGWNSNGDKILGNAKYRRINSSDGIHRSNDPSYYNWSDTTSYHYFKYEPIKWRVLKVNGSSAFLLADKALDDQMYNENSAIVTWENSSIRSWLNAYGASVNQPGMDYSTKNFLKCAFSASEQNAIQTTNVVNHDNITYSTNGGNNTSDKVFLLSEEEVCTDAAKAYGFVSSRTTYSSRTTDDEAKECKSSTYAKALGIFVNNTGPRGGNCIWWLRSPGYYYASNAAYVNDYGCVYGYGKSMDSRDNGCRPALYLNLQSSALHSYAGTVCSDGSVDEDAQGDVKISLDESMEASANEEIPISADVEVLEGEFVPDSTNMVWKVEGTNGSSPSISGTSVLSMAEDSYIVSATFSFPKEGEYKVTLKTEDGSASATMLVTIKNGVLKIKQPVQGDAYAKNTIDGSQTFSMTLENVQQEPKKSDFEFVIKKAAGFVNKNQATETTQPATVKEIRKVSPDKWEISFDFEPDGTGHYGFNVKYKEAEDDVELMVYDSLLLDKLERDLDGTVKTIYKQYAKKVKKEVKKLQEEAEAETDYVLLARELQKDSSNMMNGAFPTGRKIDQESAKLCAFEAYARAMEEADFDTKALFDKVETETADSKITQSVVSYLTKHHADGDNKYHKLDSKVLVDGKEYTVEASWNIWFQAGVIYLKVHDKEEDFIQFPIANMKSINQYVADYLNALKELELGAIKNAKKEYYKALCELLDYDFLQAINNEKQEFLKNLSAEILSDMEKHGLKNIAVNVLVYREYMKQAISIIGKVKGNVEVITSQTASPKDKLTSMREISGIKINTLDPGSCSLDIYEGLKNAEAQWQKYMQEYFTTGTIHDLETKNLGDTIKNGFKNMWNGLTSVEVVAKNGSTVGFVGPDDLWIKDDNIIIDEVGDTKIIYTPKESGYGFKVHGEDYGKASYSVEEYTNGVSAGHRVNCYDIPIEPGTIIQVSLPSEHITSAGDVSVHCATEVFEEPVMISNDVKANITLNYSGSGTVKGQGSYTLGDIVRLEAEPSSGYVFTGWYNGSQLVSLDVTYSFEARSNKSLTAKFEKILTSAEAKAELKKMFGDDYIDPDTGEKPAQKPVPTPVPEKKKVKVTKITITGMSSKIAAGKKIQLAATVLPKNATDKGLTWKSSNTSIATVTQDGLVKVKKKTGKKSVVITATAKDGSGVKASYKIKSMKYAVKSIKLSVPSTKLKAGKSMYVKAKVKVTGTSSVNKTLKWSVNKPKYASISSKGKLKAKSAGKGHHVTVTAEATDGSGKKATIRLKIK